MFNKLLKCGLSGCIPLCMMMVGPVWATEGEAYSECNVVIEPGDAVALHAELNNLDNVGKIICLKGGTYKPHPTDRNVSFEVKIDDVTLRGLIQADGSGSNHGVRLSGNIGAAPPTIEDNSKNVVTIKERSGVVIENLTIADAYNEDNRTVAGLSSKGWGAGLFIQASQVTINRVIFRDNTLAGISGSGAGLASHNSELEINDSLFQDNLASGFGGGFYVRDLGLSIPFGSGKLTMRNTVIDNNEANVNSGGIIVFDTTIPGIDTVIEGSTITNNRSAGSFGGVRIQALGGTHLMNNTLVMGNTAANNGGGVTYGDPDFVAVSNSEFIGNQAGGAGAGGGLLILSSQVNLAEPFSIVVGPNVEFRNNSAGSDGGGLELNFNRGGTFIGPNVLFEGNRAGRDGGGYDDFGEFDNTTFKGVVFRNNSAGDDGGALHSLNRFQPAASPFAKLTIDDVVFENNSTDPATASGDFNDGGALAVLLGTVDVLNSRFMNNEAGADGGAVLTQQCDHAGVVDNNHFEGNTAGDDGGVLWTALCDFTITDNTMINNMANVGPVSATSGGGGGALKLLVVGTDYVVSGNRFEGNQTLGSVGDPSVGGAILVDGIFGIAIIDPLTNNTFISNEDSPAGILTGNHIACQNGGGIDFASGNSFLLPAGVTGCPPAFP